MKKFARIFASAALKLTLASAALMAAVMSVFGSPATIKQSLASSGLYDNLVTNVFQEAKEETTDDQTSDLLAQPDIKAAAEEALPPETLKTSGEELIDGIFRWLNGEVDQPDFRIDLTDAKQRFISASGDAAQTKVEGLPTCTLDQLRNIDVNTEVFSLPCRPPGLTGAAAKTQVETELANNQEFLADPIITASTIEDEQGNDVFSQAQEAPKAFQALDSSPWILLLISLVLGAVVFFLSASHRSGAKSLGITLLGTGLFLLLAVWLISFLFNQAIQPDGAIGQAADSAMQASVLGVLSQLNGAFGKTVLIYSLGYGLTGLIVLIVLKFFWKQPPATDVDSTTTPIPETDKTTV